MKALENDPKHRALLDRALITWEARDRASPMAGFLRITLDALLEGRTWEQIPPAVREAIEFAAANPAAKSDARARLALAIVENA